ncbi:cell division protein FtsQ/DivIB [Candidatus Cardinium hertigii]|nr:FtsQ-type POTRA domain-containing protein [Candidatus Cardinium hertigii]
MRSQLIKGIPCALLAVNVGLSMLWIIKKQATLVCEHVAIHIKAYPEQVFLTTQTILDLLQVTYRIPLTGQPIKAINSYLIRDKLAMQPLIKKAVVCKTWPSTLHIALETKQLLARIIIPECPNDKQLYLDENGSILSLNTAPLCRLLVVSADTLHTIAAAMQSADKGLWMLLHQLYQDRFLRSQITSLQIAPNHFITLGTQIGNHQILFGKTENIHEKLEKLYVFYKEVIPYKGWHAYRQINVAFANQLICQ